jgi:hypothetical protein
MTPPPLQASLYSPTSTKGSIPASRQVLKEENLNALLLNMFLVMMKKMKRLC